MSTRDRAEKALHELIGRTIADVRIEGDFGPAGQTEALLLQATDGTFVRIETRDARDQESWLEAGQ